MNHFIMTLLMVALHMGANSVAAPPTLLNDLETLFETIYTPGKIYTLPDSCVENYCFEKGDNYPEDTIDMLLKDTRELPVENPKRSIHSQYNFEQRQGNNPKGNADCPANTTYTNKPIYYIIDTNDNIRVVIQSPKFQQKYTVKWCLKPGRITEDTEHFLKNSHVLENFNITCVDTYMDFDFFVLKDDYDIPKVEIVKAKGGIPVCCRCRYSNLQSTN